MSAAGVRRLADLVRRFGKVRLAVWGDLVVDAFVTGRVSRISREAPVLILDWQEERHVPGGAANTAANIAAVGATPLPLGVVGDDPSGHALRGLLQRRGMPVDGILVQPGLVTPTKTRISGAGLHTTRQQIVRLDRGAPHALAPALRRRLAALAREAATAHHGLVIGDYGYDSVDPAAVRRLARPLRTRGKVLAVDSRWRLLSYRGAGAVTPNEPEVQEALAVSQDEMDGDGILRAGAELQRRLACDSVIVTRGSRGMAVFDRRRKRPVLLPVHGGDEVADVTGAGDTVMAVYAVALAAGGSPREAARLANVAGGLVVMKQGTATVSQDELLAALEEAP